jgi:hypothetical protein
MTTLSRRALAGRFLGIAAPGTFLIRSQSSSIQDQIDRGPGRVELVAGTIDAAGLLLGDGTWLDGRGHGATVLRAPAGSDYPVLLTRRFGAMTGTDRPAGESRFRVSNLTVDGNRAANPGSNGYGMRLYGFDFCLEHVRVRDCNADGIWSEWSSSGAAPTGSDAMEATLSDVKVHGCGHDGIAWLGPHDSQWLDVVVYDNGRHGVVVAGAGGGLLAVNLHPWGLTHERALVLAAGDCYFSNLFAEGAKRSQVLLDAGSDGTVIVGYRINAPGRDYTRTNVGIQVGTAAAAVSNVYVDGGRFLLCDNGAVAFVNDGGASVYRGYCYQRAGTTAYAGKPHPGTDWYLPSNATIAGRGGRFVNRQRFLAGYTTG